MATLSGLSSSAKRCLCRYDQPLLYPPTFHQIKISIQMALECKCRGIMQQRASQGRICGKFHRKFYRCSTATPTNLYYCARRSSRAEIHAVRPWTETGEWTFHFSGCAKTGLWRCHNAEAAFLDGEGSQTSLTGTVSTDAANAKNAFEKWKRNVGRVSNYWGRSCVLAPEGANYQVNTLAIYSILRRCLANLAAIISKPSSTVIPIQTGRISTAIYAFDCGLLCQQLAPWKIIT